MFLKLFMNRINVVFCLSGTLGLLKAPTTGKYPFSLIFQMNGQPFNVLRQHFFQKNRHIPVIVPKLLSDDELALKKCTLKKRCEIIENGVPKSKRKIRISKLLHNNNEFEISL